MPKMYTNEFKQSVIDFYNSDSFSIENAMKTFKISKGTIYNWVNHFSYNEFSNKRTHYNTKFNKDVREYIVTYVSKRKFYSMENLKICVFRKFKIKICTSSIYNILKMNK